MLVGVWLGLHWVLFYFFDHYIQSTDWATGLSRLNSVAMPYHCTFSPTTFSSVQLRSLTTPFTEGCPGANNKASPPGRHQEQAPKQRCTFSPTTFSSVQFSLHSKFSSVQCKYVCTCNGKVILLCTDVYEVPWVVNCTFSA